MKFSKSWLEELVDLEIDTIKLSEQLTMVGLEVAEVYPVAKNFQGVMVGEILVVKSHPNADKLTVCQVNIGAAQCLTIVCGAPNVRSQMRVAVAKVGAKLGDLKIKKTKLRGVDSQGMMCSAVELGLGETSAGLLELPNDAPIGADLRQYLQLEDVVMKIELTPDRGDCLSLVGIAREVGAINRVARKPLIVPTISTQESSLPIVIQAEEACPHYCGRVIRAVNNQITTPIWMQERLRRSGITIINPVVDVVNYVMLETGQPLHAFALAKLTKEIQVRYAVSGETIHLLDGRELVLNSKTLVIADATKVLALAGIMGGFDSSVSSTTTDIFLESAYFVPEKLAGVARSYGLQTESSYRYERGVDYKLQLYALNRATDLLLQIVGGKPSAAQEVLANIPPSLTIDLQRDNIKKLLGISIADSDVVAILSCLEMQITETQTGWRVIIPSWRFDIVIEADLLEEIARMYGYQNIPEQKVVAELLPPLFTMDKKRIYELMVDLGYHEVITYSFTEPKLQSLLDPEQSTLPLVNPIAPELGVMRTTLWTGLVNAAKYNLSRQQQRVRFFEIGLCFLQQNDSLQQLLKLGGIVLGTVYPEQWGIKQKKAIDFFDIKHDVESILQLFGSTQMIKYIPKPHPALHPGKSTQIWLADMPIGIVGEIHPTVQQKFAWTKPAYLFEIDLSNIFNELKKTFHEFSRFPSIHRDIAIVINEDIVWQDINQKIIDISGKLLHNVELFDIYRGENIGLNKKSIAIHLVFQSVDRTLVDAEIDALVNHIIDVLQKTFAAELRR